MQKGQATSRYSCMALTKKTDAFNKKIDGLFHTVVAVKNVEVAEQTTTRGDGEEVKTVTEKACQRGHIYF